MFEKLTALLNDKLSGPMTKLANQRHLRAIRDGIVLLLLARFSWQLLYHELQQTQVEETCCSAIFHFI